MARAHIVVDDELLDEVDRIAGVRGRSGYIEAAIRDAVERTHLEAALRIEGPLIDVDAHPEWATTEKVAAWVRRVRREDW
jgi:Arc/MetJ family transcription regulator